MTVFEILNFNKELLRRLMATGVKANDCVYVDLYNDYLQMRDTGNKMTEWIRDSTKIKTNIIRLLDKIAA